MTYVIMLRVRWFPIHIFNIGCPFYISSVTALTVVLMADAVREDGDKANLFLFRLEAEVGISPVRESQEHRKRTWNSDHG